MAIYISLNCFLSHSRVWCVLIPFASGSTSISLRSSCFKNVESREVSFGKIFPSHFLLFRISPRRNPVYIPRYRNLETHQCPCCVNLHFFYNFSDMVGIAERWVTHYIIFIVNTLLYNNPSYSRILIGSYL